MTMLRSPSRGSFNDWLGTMPSPALVTLVGCFLACVVTIATLAMMFLTVTINEAALGVLASIIVGCLGGGWAGYNTKRKTWRPDLTVVQPPSGATGDLLAQSEGGTTYHVHAQADLPDYLKQGKPAPRAAVAVPVIAPDDGDAPLPPA
jgi:hypothetical protein